MAFELKQTESGKNILPKPGIQRVEIIKRNTHFSKSFLNPNGTFSAEVSSAPVNYKNKSGNWQAIDNTLILNNDGNYDYENNSNSYRLQFARNNINGKLMRLELDSEHFIELTPVDHFTQLGTAKNNTIVYKNVKQGVDIGYAIVGDTIKENIVLNSPGVNQLRYQLTYQGIKMVKEADGTIWAINADAGETLMYFRKSYAEDSKNNITTNVSNDIVNVVGKEILVITVDSTWLLTAAYTYLPIPM